MINWGSVFPAYPILVYLSAQERLVTQKIIKCSAAPYFHYVENTYDRYKLLIF